MLKRLLAVLDGSRAGLATGTLAIGLAKKTKARLTGIAVLDTPGITVPQAEPLGGAAYKLHRDDQVIKHSKGRMATLLKDFQASCAREDVACETFSLEGFPEKEVEDLSHEHDLILIGQTTDFCFSDEEETHSIVKHIAQDNPRPLIVVPPCEVTSESILVAYDGTLQSARALHMFLLLGLAEGRKIHIIHVHPKRNEAKKVVSQAQRMCQTYGVEAEIHAVATSSDPSKVILEKTEALNIGLIVMGAFSQTTLREVIFGSTTTHLMKKSKVPLFLHH